MKFHKNKKMRIHIHIRGKRIHIRGLGFIGMRIHRDEDSFWMGMVVSVYMGLSR